MKWCCGFFALVLVSAVLAQAPDTLWTRVYGGTADDWSYDIVQADDGNYVLAGSTKSFGANPTTGNAHILKIDDNGDTLWTKAYGGTSGEDVDAVQQTGDGGYILAGYTSSTGAGGADFYLLKLDADGNEEWSRAYGGSSHEEARALQQTDDGGYVIAGYTRSFGDNVPTFENFYVVKTDADGDTLWTRAYGGAGAEIAYGIEQNADGEYYVAGYTASYGSGGLDAWLVKLNANGDTIWTRTYGGLGPEEAAALTPTSDGGYALAGVSSSFTPGIKECYLVKVDAEGTSQWSRHYGGADHDQAYSVEQTYDGGFILVGTTKSYGPGVPAQNNYYFVRTDTDGDTLWTMVFGGTGNELASAVRQVTGGGYIVAGYTRSYGIGAPNANAYVIRLEPEVFIPQGVVAKVQGGNLILYWNSDDNSNYRVYSAAASAGLFETLEGSTSDTTLTITDLSAAEKFYRVVGSTPP